MASAVPHIVTATRVAQGPCTVHTHTTTYIAIASHYRSSVRADPLALHAAFMPKRRLKRGAVVFVSCPPTPFFMQEYWGGVGKKSFIAQDLPRYWLRSV